MIISNIKENWRVYVNILILQMQMALTTVTVIQLAKIMVQATKIWRLRMLQRTRMTMEIQKGVSITLLVGWRGHWLTIFLIKPAQTCKINTFLKGNYTYHVFILYILSLFLLFFTLNLAVSQRSQGFMCLSYKLQSLQQRRLFWCIRMQPYRSKVRSYSIIKTVLFQGMVYQKSRTKWL